MSSLQLEPFADLEKCAFISWFKEEGWKYFCRFVYVCFTLHIIQTSRTKLNSMIVFKPPLPKKKKKKKSMTVPFFQSTKSPHFRLRGKVGQLRKRKRGLYSIYF